MHGADTTRFNQILKIQKRAGVEGSLKTNAYPVKFIENTIQSRFIQQSSKPEPADIAAISYVQGVSDKIKRA